MKNRFVAAIDQGTTSTRCIIFDTAGQIVGSARQEHTQHFPQAGWVEHDAQEIWHNTQAVLVGALDNAAITPAQLAALGVTNQRETVVLWDRHTGLPVAPAIVWQDTRTADICRELADLGGGAARFQDQVGLPLATYFSGPKLVWLLRHHPEIADRAEQGDILAGTMDSYLLWRLTGGVHGGIHATDVTNASRTMLMDLRTLQWDPQIAAQMGVPLSMLPEIRSSSEVFGTMAFAHEFAHIPIAGMLGDQHAAMLGQACTQAGEAKNTYGTGNFLLMNTGTEPVFSQHGLLTTVCYQLGDQPATYALEGSIAVTGSLVQWLRDNLGFFDTADEIEQLAASVPDNGGAYIVPAFSGLFAPYWRPDARGVITGLTRFVTKAHLARAALEATAFQTVEVAAAMNADTPHPLTVLKVDGGMVVNNLLMQCQADVLGVPVIRPAITETTALGAAYAAGLAVGFFSDTDEIRSHWRAERTFEPTWSAAQRKTSLARWRQAVTRSFDWVA